MNGTSRRGFLRSSVGGLGILLSDSSTAHAPGNVDIRIDATRPVAAPESGYLHLGGRSRDGRAIAVNSRYLMLDGQPRLPIMGEFHFSRYPDQYWEEEILKMKAGGVDIVSTYLFWNHHEEIEGQFEWTGRRNVRRFVELCAASAMWVVTRIGPWSHGEARNGGFPDWLLKHAPLRRNAPAYLSFVKRYFTQIGEQLRGLCWSDNGPIVGFQLENEYNLTGPGAGAEHIARLKEMAVEAGLVAPLYTVTGWDHTRYPPRDVIPLFGAYCDEFWSDTTAELVDPEAAYLFRIDREAAAGILQGAKAGGAAEPAIQMEHYPVFTAERGGGMQVAYRRRPLIQTDDIAAMTVTGLGAGANLYGYYMFHGGSNPQGRLTTLEESRGNQEWSDLPVVSYDFQAPLGEFGQMHGSFRRIKLIHQFVNEFGSDLATMVPVLPEAVPSAPQDKSTPRVAARTRGDRGFIFINNYLRLDPLPERKDLQIGLSLATEKVTVPRKPVNIPSQAWCIWPVNLDLDGVTLRYATAQPLARIEHDGARYVFFGAAAGVPAEFCFRSTTFASIAARGGMIERADGLTYVGAVKPGLDTAIAVRSKAGPTTRIVLLSQEQAENAWTATIKGRERLLLSKADLFFSGDRVHIRARNTQDLAISIFPELRHRIATVQPRTVAVELRKVRNAEPSAPVRMTPIATAPDEAAFARAAVWHITLPRDAFAGVNDLFLRIRYAGDISRLYSGENLLHDNFFNGSVWEIGLKRFGQELLTRPLEVRILPLRKDAPIYLAKSSWPVFPDSGEIAEIFEVTLQPEYETVMEIE